MNRKLAFRRLQREFSDRDGLYLWQSKVSYAFDDSYLKTGKGKAFLARIANAISQTFPEHPEQLRIMFAGENQKEPFTEDQFACLENALILATLYRVTVSKTKEEKEQNFLRGVQILRMADRIDFSVLHDELSVLHQELMLCDLHCYRTLDDRSRAHVRRMVVRCANRHRISEKSAVHMYAENPLSPNTALRQKTAFILFFLFGIILCCLGFLLFDVAAGLLLIVPFFALSATFTQSMLVRFFPHIPILSLRPSSIPEKSATLVVITALLSGTENDDELFIKLRRYYYRNRCKNVRFGLLCDLPESNRSDAPQDRELLDRTAENLKKLKNECGDHFCVFVRKRTRCSTESNYMGWERKRGAILELCRACRKKEHSFRLCTLSSQQLSAFKYLITLDSDTELGIDSVKELVYTMMHPENTPTIQNGAVVSGYGVLQPRMTVNLESAGKTFFTVLQTGCGGKDSYETDCPDFDQNAFGKGSFCGKGILDIDVFLQTLDNTFPEERVLSHDLLEGCRLRCGAFYSHCFLDSVPQSPISFAKRQHRWMRGDVQSIPFSFRRHRNAEGKCIHNPIDFACRLQIIRNILFLLRPIFSFACILYALFLPPLEGTFLFLFATAHLSIPFLLRILFSAHHANRRYYSHILQNTWMAFLFLLYGFASLCENAFLNLDALLRSLYRMLVSKKHLLQWIPADHTDRLGKNSLSYCLMFFWKSLIVGGVLLILAPRGILTLFGLFTFLYPFIAYLISRPIKQKKALSQEKSQILNKYAADAYGYYREFVTKKTNHLPPDNYQYHPIPRLAERTSPTNVAMYLLSTLAARDLGFLDSVEMYTRLHATLASVQSLPKYRGHLYNWYSTKTLEVIGTPYISTVDSGNFITSLVTLRQGLSEYQKEEPRLEALITQIDTLIRECDFSFLYNKERHLFCIGYDAVKDCQSENCYDLFMSESRTTSYYCIARGIVEKKHWQYLGRPLLKKQGHMGMASWSGTGFEFFMPTLFLPTVENSLCYECLGFALYEQASDKSHGVWGRSESGYYAFDQEMNYQYKAFGARTLALDPDSAKHDVIAPYASLLCLSASRSLPLRNLEKLKEGDMYGPYGFYEAIDYTPSRVGQGYGIVRSYMAHHVGMSILAIANALNENRFVKRFMHDPEMEAAFPLLCERIPADAPIKRQQLSRPSPTALRSFADMPEDYEKTIANRLPATAGLFSENLSLWADSNGFIKLISGCTSLSYPVCDERSFLRALRCLVKTDKGIFDLFKCENGKFGRFEDCLVFSSSQKEFSHQAVFTLSCNEPILSLCLHMEGDFISACPLLFSEVILAKTNDWLGHPCYTGLFIECIYSAQDSALLFKKRPKEENEEPFWLIVTMEGGGFDFLCRRDEAFEPMYGEEDLHNLFERPFSNRDGGCIFPVFAIKRPSECPRGKFECEFLFAAGKDEKELLRRIRRHRKEKRTSVGALLAPSYTEAMKKRLFATNYDRSLIYYEQLILASILHDTVQPADKILSTRKELFWRHGISTDLPMIALYCDEVRLSDNTCRILEGFLKTQKYLRLGGVQFDLLIFHKENELYGCPMQKSIEDLVRKSVGESHLKHKAGVFPIFDSQTQEAAPYLCTVFWTVNENSVLPKLIENHFTSHLPVQPERTVCRPNNSAILAKEALLSLSVGSFLPNGIYQVNKQRCRRAHSYLYCSRQFGVLLTHNSAGVTFFRNASEFSLTKRNTDPLLDMNGERLLLEENGKFFDLCACADSVDFTRECAVYRGNTDTFRYEVNIGCDEKFPVKAILVRIENQTDVPVSLSLHYKVIPDLGNSRVIRKKRVGDTVFYRSLDRLNDEEEFGMYLSEIGLPSQIPPRQSHTCHYLLGVINYRNDRSYYAAREALGTPELVQKAFSRYAQYYRKIISKISIQSPSASLDVMFNEHIPYQTLTSRIFARTGFYQCAGAYGFRDQLQDCINMIPLDDTLVRQQILRCACHQYSEGDVQHWWHESPSGPNGMRTRCSDDLLWLPFAVAEYISQTGKKEILDLKLCYLSSPPLAAEEEHRYEKPNKSSRKESLLMHCMRAMDLCLSRMGEKGLPLFGSGDWNDGMNRVGIGGKGESVWLAMFLVLVLERFSLHCLPNGEDKDRYLNAAETLRQTILNTCYENDRFLRGFFDCGLPLGSTQNKECRIDLLPQAFSVFLYNKDKRCIKAMESAYRELFDRENRILKLFTPAFDEGIPDPGYIRGYLPGIRENGGQYTHSAMWGALAFFSLNMNDRGYEVLCGANPAARYLIPSLSGRYCLEPYALAGDIYAGQNGGCGGWSWYTGAAGWFYTAVLKGMLGYTAKEGKIYLCPHLPSALDRVSIKIQKDSAIKSKTLFLSQNQNEPTELV